MKNKRLYLFAAIILLALSSGACRFLPFFNVVRGSGDLVSEVRTVSEFNSIRLDGAGQLLITQVDSESLEITAEDNMINDLTSEVQNGTLVLGFQDSPLRKTLFPTRIITYTLMVRDLDSITVNGAGDLQIDTLQTDSLALTLNGAGQFKINTLEAQSLEVLLKGAGNIEVGGEVTSQDIKIEGAANYQGDNLRTSSTVIEISGLGNGVVWATNTLNVSISGAGNLDYYGSPTVTQNIGGAGNVQSRGDK